MISYPDFFFSAFRLTKPVPRGTCWNREATGPKRPCCWCGCCYWPPGIWTGAMQICCNPSAIWGWRMLPWRRYPWWLVDFGIFLVNTGIIIHYHVCNIICWIFVEHILKLRLEKSRTRCFFLKILGIHLLKIHLTCLYHIKDRGGVMFPATWDPHSTSPEFILRK